MKRDFISVYDLSSEEITSVLENAIIFKTRRKWEKFLDSKNFVLLFEKPSLRTRMSFEVGIRKVGGSVVYLAPSDINLGTRESVQDVARNLDRWVDGIILRVFKHKNLLTMQKETKVPIINALSEMEHPCQALADVMTMKEHRLNQHTPVAYIGDGNNVCNSLILIFALLGLKLRIATPEGYEPAKDILDQADEISRRTGAEITYFNKPESAVKDAYFVYTDVWTSMGQENKADERKRVFKPYQVNKELIKRAKEDAKFMHCLPAHRGEEVTDEVIDGPNSIVYDQAENRMWSQMALLKFLYD